LEVLVAQYPIRTMIRAPVHPGEVMREIMGEHVQSSVPEGARRRHQASSLDQ
jgi:hypothetical protein